MTRETLAMTRDDSDSKLMTRDSTRNSALGKSDDSRLDSRLDSHDSCTAATHSNNKHETIIFRSANNSGCKESCVVYHRIYQSTADYSLMRNAKYEVSASEY